VSGPEKEKCDEEKEPNRKSMGTQMCARANAWATLGRTEPFPRQGTVVSSNCSHKGCRIASASPELISFLTQGKTFFFCKTAFYLLMSI
jgi:hypothetical protein